MLKAYDGPPRVIVGFDGSDDSSRALAYGAAEALVRSAELVLLHAVDDTVLNSAWGVVFDPDEIRAAAQELLTAGVQEAMALGLPAERVRTQVELGNPAAALAHFSEAASLIVVGRRSVASGERGFVGSTAVGIAGTARCPVIVVTSGDVQPAQRTGLIGVGVSTAAKGENALEWALQECGRRGGAVVVLSVCRAPVSRFFHSGAPSQAQQDEAIAITRARVEQMIAPLSAGHPDVPVSVEVGYGNPLDVLVARTADVDLMIVEVHPSFPTYSVGGITRGLMTHALCPVGTIRDRDSHGS
ncbi:MAG: universal stress protein [Propionibacteriaceae bacterium]|nr:universal stress protein [Propionibacteriaceae bacterium]